MARERLRRGVWEAVSNTTEPSPVGSEADGFSGDRDKARKEQRMLGEEKMQEQMHCPQRCYWSQDGSRAGKGGPEAGARERVIGTVGTESNRKRPTSQQALGLPQRALARHKNGVLITVRGTKQGIHRTLPLRYQPRESAESTGQVHPNSGCRVPGVEWDTRSRGCSGTMGDSGRWAVARSWSRHLE